MEAFHPLKLIDIPIKSDFLSYVDPVKHLEASRRKNIDFCFHSHPGTSCEPSVADIELANNALISFLIFSPLEDRFAVYNPKSEETIYFSI